MSSFTAIFNTLVVPTIVTKQYEGETKEVCSQFINDCRNTEKLCWMLPSTLWDSDGQIVTDYLGINESRPDVC